MNLQKKSIVEFLFNIVLATISCIVLFALFFTFARADYSYQTYFSQYKEVWNDCRDVITKTQEIIGYKNHAIEISSLNNEKARLQRLLSDIDSKLVQLKAEDGQPIYGERENTIQVCTERVVELPYCGDGRLDKGEQCELGDANCTATCECKNGYMMINQGLCAGVPMSENKEPELPMTGANPKKVLFRKKSK